MQTVIDAEDVLNVDCDSSNVVGPKNEKWTQDRLARAQLLAKHYLHGQGIVETPEVVEDDANAGATQEVALTTQKSVERTAAVHQPARRSAPKEFGGDTVRIYLNEIGKNPLLNAEQETDLAKQIEAGLYAQHILSTTELSDGSDHERSLRLIAVDGAKAKKVMIESNTRLAVSIAKRYTGRGMQFLDLIQEANMGLIRGVEKFDYTKGFKFSTYATWWIRQSITRGLADQQRTIRLPVHTVEKVNKAARIKRELYQVLGHEPSNKEIADEMNISEQKLEDLFKLSQDAISLNTPVGDGEEELGSFVNGGDDEDGIVDGIAIRELSSAVRNAVSSLGENEQMVINLRNGMNGQDTHTLAQIGEIMGLTGERVRQIERNALSKLRNSSYAQKLQAHHESS
ncbi:sigma-70 family RNA polymerase sigma factor [bacterium]|nr:MAG: sigma-70 family RNA polymerase sigma factor [bacterium]